MANDVIIVGARCAGAPLATFLARGGAKVLLLDKDRLPSEQVLSTHELHAPALDVLEKLGVADELRRVSPQTRRMRLRKGRATLDIDFAEGRYEYCPRRYFLDGLLLQAAVKSGVEVCDQTRLVRLLWDGDRVCGVRVHTSRGERDLYAKLVIGADGRHSKVAAEVRAPEYLAYDGPRAMYFAYFPAPAFWHTDPAYDFGMYVGRIGHAMRVIFQTDGDQLLIGSLPATHDVARWKADPLSRLQQDLAQDPLIAPLVAGQNPTEKVRGTIRERYFFRQPVGPGWALVGDAGVHKEFVTGDGITDALLQARSLAQAVLSNRERSLETFWRARDVATLPLYFFGKREGAWGAPSDLEQALFEYASHRPEIRARLARMLDHQLAPNDVFGPGEVLPIVLSGFMRGKFNYVRDFLRFGKASSEIQKELSRRKQLYALSLESTAKAHSADPLASHDWAA